MSIRMNPRVIVTSRHDVNLLEAGGWAHDCGGTPSRGGGPHARVTS